MSAWVHYVETRAERGADARCHRIGLVVAEGFLRGSQGSLPHGQGTCLHAESTEIQAPREIERPVQYMGAERCKQMVDSGGLGTSTDAYGRHMGPQRRPALPFIPPKQISVRLYDSKVDIKLSQGLEDVGGNDKRMSERDIPLRNFPPKQISVRQGE